jgi:hypothetical protein
MKGRIWKGRMKYFILKEKMKENECGWSEVARALTYDFNESLKKKAHGVHTCKRKQN